MNSEKLQDGYKVNIQNLLLYHTLIMNNQREREKKSQLKSHQKE